MNNAVENLQAVTTSEHNAIHHTGRKLSDKLVNHKGRFINKDSLAALETVGEEGTNG